MYIDNRTSEEYLSGVKSFISAAEAYMLSQNKSSMFCPCRDFKNIKEYRNSLNIHAHLIIRGFIKKYKYTCWNKHGEIGVNDGELDEDLPDKQPDQDDMHICQDLSDHNVVDISGNCARVVENLEEMVRDTMENDDDIDGEFAKLKQLVRDAKIPLYPGCKEKYTKLFMTLKLLQLKATHHWTDRSFKALLDLLHDMLPEGNEIPRSTYDAKKIICPMGLEVEKIHACKNDCILFRGDNADLTECPECGASRYKRRKDGGDDKRKNGASRKVAWYFPVIPHVNRMFASKKEAQLLR